MKQQYLKVAGAKASAAIIIAALAMPTIAIADNVELKSYDGSARFTGYLIAYDDGRYRIDTALGVLLISAGLVKCEGMVCPPQQIVDADVLAAQGMRPINTASN